MKQSVSNIFFIIITGAGGNTITVSQNGSDSIDCGQTIPCCTIGFVLTHKAAKDCIIKIVNDKSSKPFIVNTSFPIPENITLLGTGRRRPIIFAKGPFQPTHLFEGRDSQKVKFITLNIKNLILRGMGILRLFNNEDYNNILFLNSYFKNIVTSKDIIRIESHRYKLHNGLIHFHQCHFENNVASGSSTIISIMHSRSLFHNCYFKKNLFTGNGTVFLKGRYNTFRNSNFEKNMPLIKDFFFGFMGGAIHSAANSTTEILECHFKGNVAILGGAIFMYGKKLVIKSSLFENNIAGNKYQSKAAGGAVFLGNGATSEIMNCSFDHNEAYAGGAIYTKSKALFLKSSLFQYNVALKGGAIYAFTNSIVEIFECQFKENRVLHFGAAILTFHTKIVTVSSLFENNTARNKYQTKTAGGAIVVSGTTSKILNCSFNQNEATYVGGALVIINSITEIIECQFKENKASRAGGGVCIYGKKLLIVSSLFENNTVGNKHRSRTGGGAIFLRIGAISEILNCSFNQNQATYAGGAVTNQGKTLIRNCSFRQNEATYAGGAISNQGKTLIIKSSLLEYNAALDVGGAVYSSFNSILDILNCSFKWNKVASKGGAVFSNARNLTIKSSLFEYNAAVMKYTTTNFTSIVAMGGAIGQGNSSLFGIILNCSFKKNMAGDIGGAISVQAKTLVVKSSFFYHNTVLGAGAGGAIFCAVGNLTCYIFSCSFEENIARVGGAIYFFSTRFILKASSFENNSASDKGGALFIYSLFPGEAITILDCFFSNNKAVSNGGAVSHCGEYLLMRNTKFQKNIASGMSGEGGALFTKGTFTKVKLYTYYVEITHCIFDGNQASFRGGGIMSETTDLYIRNSSLQSSSDHHSDGYLGGELLYSKSNVILEYVSLKDVDRYNPRNSLIVHQNFLTNHVTQKHTLSNVLPLFSEHALMITLKQEIHIKCFTGKDMAVSYHASKSSNKLKFLIVSCSFCSQNYYSLHTSHMDLISLNQSIKKTNAKCYQCPLGGVCEKGNIRAAENFWGYKFGEQVHFVSCPYGYCCYKEECVNYSGCHTGRTGNLCGNCAKGLTENLATPDCLPPKHCHHPLYSLAVIIAGIMYVTILLYLNEIMKILKSWLIPKSILERFKLSEICKSMWQFAKSKVSNDASQDRQMHYLTDDVIVLKDVQEEVFESMPDNIYLPSNEEMQSVLASQKDNEGNFFPGLMKIMVHFFQTSVLFRVYTGSKSHGFVHMCQEAISTLFNLRTDGLFTQDLHWCPFKNLKPVSKVLFKSSFIVYLFLLISLAFILCKIGKLLKIIDTDINNSRFFCCTLRLIFISYAGVTTACFSLLSCIHLGNYGRVLFIDGSVQCYKTWQKILIFIVCGWIVPFPITIHTSAQMLRNKMLSMKQFCLCLLFPLPAVCYCFYRYRFDQRKEVDDMEEPNQGAQDVLEIIEGPFRIKNHHCNTEKNYRLSWTSILIGRRFILILIKTFLINTFARLFTMLLCTIVFLIHHIYVKPFSSSLLNYIETLSLFMLTAICLLNLVPAYNYAYPNDSYKHIKDVIQILKDSETVLNLVFPALVGILVAALICIRIFQFIFWLCLCFVKLIRFCTKYKLS